MADRDAQGMSALIDALDRMDRDRRGVTTAAIIDTIRTPPAPVPEWHGDLKSAVEEMCGKLDGRTLGYRFRQYQRRNFGGRMLDKAGEDRNHGNRWAVFDVAKSTRAEPSPASPASPANPPRDAGDAGDAGHDPGHAESSSANGKVGRRRYRNDDRPHNHRG
jgi:hypothetical protein